MIRDRTSQHIIATNPFYVLGLPVTCTRMEVEREGQKLLGMLELNMEAARLYHTPIGDRTRSPELVREAMSELRDPQRRLAHELWGSLECRPDPPAETEPEAGRQGWHGAMAALGWRANT